jgi:cation diffusion facilitator CzcD-associated flavoprotein CzcO
VTMEGIEARDGTHTELDVIVCATGGSTSVLNSTPNKRGSTGFDISFQYPFTIVGKGGVSLHERFDPHPVTYLALCVDEFPNFFLIGGPNASVNSSSYITLLDKKVMYAVEATRKLQRERLKSMVVKKDAVRDFDEYLEVRHLP